METFETEFSVALRCSAYMQEHVGVISSTGISCGWTLRQMVTLSMLTWEVQVHKTMRYSADRFKFLDLIASGIG